MIIKVQNDSLKDRFLVEAAFIKWCYPEDTNHVILEIHIVAIRRKASGDTSISFTGIEEVPSLRLRIYDGDRVFIMNNDGKTIDSKRILLT